MLQKPDSPFRLAALWLISLALPASCLGIEVSSVSVIDASSSTLSETPATNLFDGDSSERFSASRLNESQPIITKETFTSIGVTREKEIRNINGPSMVRVPDWIPANDRADPRAVYYLYFANHHGDYIRMAWAEDIEGPYALYNSEPDRVLPDRGVLGLEQNDELDIGGGIVLDGHIASPDVIVDSENRRFIMYFHSPSKTYVATSDNGLDFNGRVEPITIGDQYMRIFEWNGELFGSAGDEFFKAPSLSDPWTPTSDNFDRSQDILWLEDDLDFFDNHFVNTFVGSKTDPSIDPNDLRMRHTDILVIEDRIHLFYSRKDDLPERIVSSTVTMNTDFNKWTIGDTLTEILISEEDWEGANITPEISTGGSDHCCVQQLRDPDVFVDLDGSMYLTYSGQGEDAIGIASLTMENYLVDTNNSWTSTGLQSGSTFVVLDLGARYDISQITLYPEDSRDYQYLIQISDTQTGGFATIVDRSSNTTSAESFTDTSIAASGRYLRLEILGAHSYEGDFASIEELTIEGIISSGASSFQGDAFADLDGDGLAALLEYAHGTSDSDASDAHDAFFVNTAEGQTFLTYRFNPNAQDAQLEVQASDDFQNWDAADNFLELTDEAFLDSNHTIRTLRLIDLSDRHRFFRLKASLN